MGEVAQNNDAFSYSEEIEPKISLRANRSNVCETDYSEILTPIEALDHGAPNPLER